MTFQASAFQNSGYQVGVVTARREVWWPRTLEDTYWHLGKKKRELEEFLRQEAIEEARLAKIETAVRAKQKKEITQAALQAFIHEQGEAKREILHEIRELETYIENLKNEQDEELLLLMSNYPL